MKRLKRMLSLGAAAAMLMSCTVTANALLTQNSVSTITTTEELKSSSTVYVGEVVVGGVSRIKYVYSADLSHNSYVWKDLQDSLSGMEDTDFAGLFPDEFDSESEEKGLKLCNVSDYVADMDESWASASAVGEKYYSPTYVVSAESSENLYDADEGFKAKLDAEKAERVEAYDEPIDNNKTIITHLDPRTVTDVYYMIDDGQVVRHYDTNVIYDCEEITVIYTRAEMKIDTNTVINVTGKQAKVLQASTLYVGEVVVDGESMVKYLWSDDITRAETVFGTVKNSLNSLEDKDFFDLMPYLVGQEETKGIAVCSVADHEGDMNGDWADAGKVAALYCPDKTAGTTQNADLYETDEAFASANRAYYEDVELVDNAGVEYVQHSLLGQLSATNTDSVTYTVDKGKLIKLIDRHIDYTCEAVTVIYTKVEVTSAHAAQKVSGSIYSGTSAKAPLEGAAVTVKDTDFMAAVTGTGYSVDLPDGSYTLVVSKAGFAQREFPVTVKGGALTQDLVINRLGDTDGNNKVEPSDCVDIKAHLTAVAILDGYQLAAADTDGNGKVEVSDYTMAMGIAKGIIQ